LTLALAGAGSLLTAAETIEPRTGTVTVTEVDLRVRAGVMSLDVERVYQSGEKAAGMLGTAWRLTLEKRLISDTAGVRIQEAGGAIPFTLKEGAGAYAGPAGESLSLEPDRPVRQRSDGVEETYDSKGRLTEIRRPGGSAIALQYNPAGRLVRVEGPGGAFLRFVADAQGRIGRVESSTGDTAVYRYVNGALAEVQVNGGAPLRYRYDSRGRIDRSERPGAGPVDFEYDADGRVIRRSFAGAQETWEYTAAGVRHTGAGGGVTTVRWDPLTRRQETVDPLGNTVSATFDDAGRPASITGPTGEVTRFSYDALGRTTTTEAKGGVVRMVYVGDTRLPAAIAYPDGSRQTFEYDNWNRLKTVRDGDEISASFTYQPDGLVTSVKGAGIPERRYAYYPDGRPKSETNAAGEMTRFEYDQRGNRIRQIDSAGGVTAYAYDQQGQLSSVTKPSGAVTRYVYDAAGRIVEWYDPAGGKTRYEFDAAGRMAARFDRAGRVTRYEYDSDGRVVRVVHPGGAAWSYAYDAAGNLLRQTNPLGGVTRYTYDALGQALSVTDPVGLTLKYEYKAAGQLARMIGPGGEVVEVAYDAHGRRQGFTGAAVNSVRLDRDSHGRVSKILLPNGTEASLAYDQAGNLLSETTNRGDTVEYEHDAMGRRTRLRDSGGLEVSARYDALGRLAGLRDSQGASLGLGYNPQGLIASITDSIGSTTQFEYDAGGRLIGVVDPLGQTRQLSYSPAGDLAQVRAANGDTVRLEYDPAGRVEVMRLPGGGVVRYEYDAMGHPVTAVEPSGAKTRWNYDLAGRLVSATGPAGSVTAYVYDGAGRLARKQLPDGKVVTYRYDAAGKIAELDDGVYSVRYAYNRAGQVTSIAYPAIRRKLEYEYDASGSLVKFTDSEGRTVGYRYDAHKRLAAMVLPDGQAVQFSYDARGRVVSAAYPNGVTGAWEYDAAGRLGSIFYRNTAGEVLLGWRYGYDAAGNPLTATDFQGRMTRYAYDAAGQLLEEQAPSETLRYTYQPGGDRTSRRGSGGELSYQYNPAGQLVQVGQDRLVYDGRGDVLERRGASGITRYAYDGQNRLVRVTGPDGAVVEYGYGPTGERVWKRDNRGLAWLVSDGRHLLAELDANLRLKTSYVHAPGLDRPLAVEQSGQRFFYHAKSEGTIAGLTDATGKLAASYETDAFGNLTASNGRAPNRFLYTAREFEPETGLYYYRARYYDPSLGRFLSPDPQPGSWLEPASLNRYAYARNAPTRYRDPMGLYILDDKCIWDNFQLNSQQIEDIVDLYAGPASERWAPIEEYNFGRVNLETDLMQAPRELKGEALYQYVKAKVPPRTPMKSFSVNAQGQAVVPVQAPPQQPQSPGSAGEEDSVIKWLRAQRAAEQAGAQQPAPAPAAQPAQASPEPPGPAPPTPSQAKMSTKVTPGAAPPMESEPLVPEASNTVAAPAQAPVSAGAPELPAAVPPEEPPAPVPAPAPVARPGVGVNPPAWLEAAPRVGGTAAGVVGAAAAWMNYQACLEEGHSNYDCMKEAAMGAAWGCVPLAGGALAGAGVSLATGGAVGSALAGVTIAGAIIAVPAAAYGAYYGSQRLGEAPAVLAEKKLREQQAINAQFLPQAVQELSTIFENEAPAIESLAATAREAGRSAGSRQTDIQKALDEGAGELNQLKGMAGGLIGSLKARCEQAQTKMAELQALTAKADGYRQRTQDAEWLKSHASDPCSTPAAANELAAHLQGARSTSSEISQWAANVKAKQAELAALKSARDADLQTVEQAEAHKTNVLAAADRANSLIAAYTSDADKYRGLRAQFQQRLAALRNKVEHLPDAMPSPLPKLAQNKIDEWRTRLASLGDLEVEFNLPPLPTDLRAQAVGMRLDAENQMSSIRAAADACDIDSGDDAVRDADALAASAGEALAAAACGQQGGAGTGANANGTTGFEPQGADEKTIRDAPPSSPPGTDNTNQVGPDKTGSESKGADEKTVQEKPAGQDNTNQVGPGPTTTPPVSNDQNQVGPGKTGFEPERADEKTIQQTGTGNTNQRVPGQGSVDLVGVQGSDQFHPGGGGSQGHVTPVVKPADPGELEGDWFVCCALNYCPQRELCLTTGRGGAARSGGADQIIRFTKSGHQYDGRLAPDSGIGRYSGSDWYMLYHPGDPRFRLTRTSANQYEGQEFRCYYPPGFDPELNRGRSCNWEPGRAVITVQGDEAVAEQKPFGSFGVRLVRSKGQRQALPGQFGQSPTDCVAKSCPVCTQSVSLIGASAPECESCKSRFAAQIAQCNQQGASPGPGRYDTRGLEDPPVYCAYAVPQPNFNPNVRYEIGKCNDVHPIENRKIYGPETFMHCREWLTKMGLAQ